MARRRDQAFGGRTVAGEHGDLFLNTDGRSALWDDQERDLFPTDEVAEAAWQRARRRTWAHPDREEVWPPEGAIAWDQVSASARDCFPCRGWRVDRVLAAVDADLASVVAFRQNRPAAAASVEAYLAEYETALHQLAGLAEATGNVPAGRVPHDAGQAWLQITRRGEG